MKSCVVSVADLILDMLQSEAARTAILSYYQDSEEPAAVRGAIQELCTTSEAESDMLTKQR